MYSKYKAIQFYKDYCQDIIEELGIEDEWFDKHLVEKPYKAGFYFKNTDSKAWDLTPSSNMREYWVKYIIRMSFIKEYASDYHFSEERKKYFFWKLCEKFGCV